VINPSVFDPHELYGKIKASTGELKDGIITKILRSCYESKLRDSLTYPVWIVFDGPMQNGWVAEGVNSLFDKDCTVTLHNCDKVSVGQEVRVSTYPLPSIIKK